MHLLSTNIISPLGFTTAANYQSVKAGHTAISRHEAGTRGVPFPFTAALFSEEQWEEITAEGMTRFESLAMQSARRALEGCAVDAASPRTVFILSTTKGDILTSPAGSAVRIARALGVTTTPVVTCNACISGVAAQILAQRLTDGGFYDHAIVCGADVQGEFIISGFQSLKALSDEPCRPFDAERTGLNLGEAAATMVYAADRLHRGEEGWRLVKGAIRNDAYHVSGPHPKGEGCLRALRQVMGRREDLAVVGVHGTATMYNDQMESVAIERAGLSDIPLSALKGYYGHTMGAAGLLETVITAAALDDGGTILPSLGYHERGVSGKVNISAGAMHTEKREFIKVLSGFGGCNGAIRLTRSPYVNSIPQEFLNEVGPMLAAYPDDDLFGGRLRPDPDLVMRLKPVSGGLVKEYRRLGIDYPKFHKMDELGKRAFLATERLLQGRELTQEEADRTAVVFFNRTSSLAADRKYLATITDKENYFPSPSLFVHTLPNISTGEVAIRHGIHGETSFYILPRPDETLQRAIISATLRYDSDIRHIITGWTD